jgi:protein TonB
VVASAPLQPFAHPQAKGKIMASHVLKGSFEPGWSWLRISGLSGSFAVHAAALVLLALPVALPDWEPEPEVIAVTFPEPVAELPVSAVPPEPVPPTIVRRREQVVPTPQPVAREDSAMAVPVTMPLSDLAVPADNAEAISAVPAIATNASLAYESIIEPSYPIDSRRRGEQGTVLLRVRVGRDGLPIEIDIERSSGYRKLDRAAREAVLRWRFRPVQINGVNVEARGLVPIRFDVGQG